MRYMCDSTNINDDPTSFQLVAYYCDGNFAVSEAAVRARFPHAILVPISAIGTNSGVVGDCEPGCMTEDELVTWCVERRAAAVDPTGYVNEMNDWVPAREAFARRGVAEPHWWVADYDGLDVIPPGAVAKQDKNSAMTGGHFDKSVVADYWPGVDGAFGNPALELSGGKDDLFFYHDTDNNDMYSVFFDDDLCRFAKYHVSPAEWSLVALSKPPVIDVTSGVLEGVPDATTPPAVAAPVDLSAVVAAAQAAQAAAQASLAAIQSAAADIKAVRAKTDADLH